MFYVYSNQSSIIGDNKSEIYFAQLRHCDVTELPEGVRVAIFVKIGISDSKIHISACGWNFFKWLVPLES